MVIQNSNLNITQDKIKARKKWNMIEFQMLKPENKINILDEANNLYPKISLTQLFSTGPSIRKESWTRL